MTSNLSGRVKTLYGGAARRFKQISLSIALLLATPPAFAAPITILAFGDSLTQGYGLPKDAGLVPQLETWLNRHGAKVTIINGGVSGDTTAGGLARIDWSLTDKVQAVIVTIGGNDYLRGIDPDTSRQNIAGILQVLQDRALPTLLNGIPAPANFGPQYQAKVRALYPELAAEFGTIFNPNYFAAITPMGAVVPDAKFLQADLTHPNAEGVELIVEKLGPLVQTLLAQIPEP